MATATTGVVQAMPRATVRRLTVRVPTDSMMRAGAFFSLMLQSPISMVAVA